MSKIYLELGIHVDVIKEIERLNKNLEEKRKFKEKLEAKINAPNREKMPEKVRNEQNQQMQKFIAE